MGVTNEDAIALCKIESMRLEELILALIFAAPFTPSLLRSARVCDDQ